MGEKILTKTDRQMEDHLHAVSDDPERAGVIAKARAFKRTWLELAQALTHVQNTRAWERWGHADFDTYCRKELHLRQSTVGKLLGSYRFLETAAPRVIERVQKEPLAPVPSMAAVDFVAKASQRGAADAETLQSIHRAAFDDGEEAPMLTRRFKDAAFPETEADRSDKLRGQLAATGRRLASLLAEPDGPVPRKLAIRLEEALGELMAAVDSN